MSALAYTLLFDYQCDLDLWFFCHDGQSLGWNAHGPTACQASLDEDMTSSDYGNTRGDG